jgi:hypothetical protein
MSLKSLVCVSVAAFGLMVSAKDAAAQNWWNPLGGLSRPAYGTTHGYNPGMNCANGVCKPKPINSAYCPNGNCNVPPCGPNGCGVNSYGYGSNFRAPAYRSTPGYFETQRVPVTRSTNYRLPPTGYGRVNPFYP